MFLYSDMIPLWSEEEVSVDLWKCLDVIDQHLSKVFLGSPVSESSVSLFKKIDSWSERLNK